MDTLLIGFNVKVEGEYFAYSKAVSGETVIKSYEIVVALPSMERAMSVIKNKLLSHALAKKYEDFKAFRTYNITSIKPLNEESKKKMKGLAVMYLDRESLLGIIADENLPVEAELYPHLFKLREAVESARANKDHFVKQQDLNRPSLLEDQALAALNPDILPQENVTASIEAPVQPNNNKPAAVPGPKKALDATANNAQAENRLAAITKDDTTIPDNSVDDL